MRRLLMLCGMLAVILYVGTVILGGLLRPSYSHLSQAVSDLIATGVPNKSLLDPLFIFYNLLTLAFGIGLLQRVRAVDQPRGTRAGTLGALFLVAEGIFGFATVFSPEDAQGVLSTSTGTMHILLAALSSFTTMLTILFIGFWFRGTTHLRGASLYSFISVAGVFVSGGLAAMSIANHSPLAGLVERITIGGFLQWLFVIAAMMYSSDVTRASASPST
jgi:hypothetical protein